MTLGQKLAGYRKISGMTQQQLGDYLNISPQAISKWEKDISEPALATLRALASLYKISVDELLDLESGFGDAFTHIEDEEEENVKGETSKTIGFCKNCGIVVSDENVGSTQPFVICNNCLEEQNRERTEKEKKDRQEREIERKRRQKYIIISYVVAALVALPYLAFTFSGTVTDFSLPGLLVSLIGTYVIFSFVNCLFYDCFVRDVVIDWFTKTVNLPGVIFSFDLDGLIFLIVVKIALWVLGLLIGLVFGAVGVAIGLISAPFVFPFVITKEHRELKAV